MPNSSSSPGIARRESLAMYQHVAVDGQLAGPLPGGDEGGRDCDGGLHAPTLRGRGREVPRPFQGTMRLGAVSEPKRQGQTGIAITTASGETDQDTTPKSTPSPTLSPPLHLMSKTSPSDVDSKDSGGILPFGRSKGKNRLLHGMFPH